MNSKRPVNLDLRTMRFPAMAIASILHRLSGVVLFLTLPLILYFFHLSLHSIESFTTLQILLTKPGYQLLIWVFGSALIYHLLAGARHMIMDMGVGEQVSTARYSAVFVIVLAIILTTLLGLWIW